MYYQVKKCANPFKSKPVPFSWRFFVELSFLSVVSSVFSLIGSSLLVYFVSLSVNWMGLLIFYLPLLCVGLVFTFISTIFMWIILFNSIIYVRHTTKFHQNVSLCSLGLCKMESRDIYYSHFSCEPWLDFLNIHSCIHRSYCSVGRVYNQPEGSPEIYFDMLTVERIDVRWKRVFFLLHIAHTFIIFITIHELLWLWLCLYIPHILLILQP